MLSFIARRPNYFNKKISYYCTETTNESVKKLHEKYSLERNNKKIINPLKKDDDSEKPEFKIYHFIMFLSTSYAIYFFFNKKLK
jgi:hypothetical protein